MAGVMSNSWRQKQYRRDTRHAEIGVMWAGLVFTSIALLLLSRLDHSYVRYLRGAVAEAFGPVLSRGHDALAPVRWAASKAAAALEMTGQHERLKQENLELTRWKTRAEELERQLADLSTLARTVQAVQPPSISARVIATAPGGPTNSVLIAAGRQHQVLVGHAVITASGLVGRVVDARQSTARVMLLTDLASRIPVHVGEESVRALMSGDNGPMPRLGYVPEGKTIKVGDRIVTSGVGGLLPRGLHVGEVVEVAGHYAVRLAAHLGDLEYVAVLLYDAPELELSDGPGARSSGQRAQAGPDARREVTP